MTERKTFEMTEDQRQALLQAMYQPMILLQCGPAPSPQENANAAWARLGKEMGFNGKTVEPVYGKGDTFFSAEILPPVAKVPPPVDPLRDVVRAAVIEALDVSVWRCDFNDGDVSRPRAEGFLDRLIPLLRAADIGMTPPVDLMKFTHLVDAHGNEIPVEFVSGPHASIYYCWRILGEHIVDPLNGICHSGSHWNFLADGTCPEWPAIHLIRDTKSESAPG